MTKYGIIREDLFSRIEKKDSKVLLTVLNQILFFIPCIYTKHRNNKHEAHAMAFIAIQ